MLLSMHTEDILRAEYGIAPNTKVCSIMHYVWTVTKIGLAVHDLLSQSRHIRAHHFGPTSPSNQGYI